MSRIGLELTERTVRAVKVWGWPRPRLRTLEVSWEPEQPAEALAMVKEELGSARQVAAAVDLALLRVKRLRLPPLPLGEKRRLLGLEPDRFFAVRGEDLVFAVREDDDLVFAAPEHLVTAWVEALQSIGPLERLEPSPTALARFLGTERIDDAVVLTNGGSAGLEMTIIGEGRVRAVRRLYGGLAEAADVISPRLEGSEPESGDEGASRPAIFLFPWQEERAQKLQRLLQGTAPQPAPDLDALDPAFQVAYGAVLSPRDSWRESLVTPDLERRIDLRKRSQLGVAAVACIAALVFAVASLDASRDRAERRLDAHIAALRERASAALVLQNRLEELSRELAALDRIEGQRSDPLSGLLELSRQLPEGAWIRSIIASDGEWEIDGYARDAAALIPLFENDPRFEDVRFLSGTSRALIGNETYENFTLGLRAVRAP